MFKRVACFIFCCLFITLLFPIMDLEAYPVVDMGRVDSIPDLLQTSSKGKFDLGGLFHCGPVAVSNSLAWLYLGGYRNLLPGIEDVADEQIELARTLGSSRYMKTDFSKGGTTTEDLIEGVEKYLLECGYHRSKVFYAGWDPSAGSSVRIPDMAFIKGGFERAGSVILNIGWYIHDTVEDVYTRKSGHWVTLAGYGLRKNGIIDEKILVIHDPAPWAGKGFMDHYVKFEPILKGLLSGEFKGLPVNAEGFLVAREGLAKPSEGVHGIVEGAVVIKMEVQFPFTDFNDNFTEKDI